MVSPFLGLLTRAPGIGLVTFAAGLLTLGTAAVVHLITLPTELNASFDRALPILDEHHILKPVIPQPQDRPFDLFTRNCYNESILEDRCSVLRSLIESQIRDQGSKRALVAVITP